MDLRLGWMVLCLNVGDIGQGLAPRFCLFFQQVGNESRTLPDQSLQKPQLGVDVLFTGYPKVGMKIDDLHDLHLRARTRAGRNRVGGGLTTPVLPHHRTYGSVSGGSREASKSPMLCDEADEAQSPQHGRRHGLVHMAGPDIPPWTASVIGRNGRTGCS